ncbi:hypothetical protein [Amycolatopsis sp. CA-230715]|uniref:hypothetical protein n=1 Tax=Amycolatopsis sp. CA-230715 TaxID=2745196 RepID=UPI001C023252|nr:hypothetical protein [Amycolatopsis sp. CA-230715]QWF80635.1 hypothetical protein HUW46_04058 [Amycolatopsis sp. CA-230715]
MNQQYPNQPYPNRPYPGGPPPGYQGFPGGQPGGIPPKKSRTKLVVGAVGAAVVLIAGAIVVVAVSKSGGAEDAKAGTPGGGDGKPVARTERPGYQYQAAVADPFAIVEEPNPTPSHYNGKPVTQACNLVSLKELADHGVHLASRAEPGYALNRNYLADEAVPDQANPPKPSDQTLNETPDQNFCEYNVEFTAGGGASPEVFKIDVYQPPYYDISKIRDLYLSGDYVKYAKQESIGQVELYTPIKHPVSSRREVILRLGDTYVWVTALVSEQGGELATRFDPLVKTVAANIAKQAANPTGPSRYRYDSPTFKTPAGLASDILLPSDVKTLLGKPASPVTKNDLATAIGKISVPEDHTEGNFLHTACTRRIGDGLHEDGFELTVDTYDDAKLAAGVFRFHRGAAKGLSIPTAVGDEAYVDSVGDALTQPGALVVRKGNAVLALATSVKNLDLNKMVETADKYLRPVVEQMLTRLPK